MIFTRFPPVHPWFHHQFVWSYINIKMCKEPEVNLTIPLDFDQGRTPEPSEESRCPTFLKVPETLGAPIRELCWLSQGLKSLWNAKKVCVLLELHGEQKKKKAFLVAPLCARTGGGRPKKGIIPCFLAILSKTPHPDSFPARRKMK